MQQENLKKNYRCAKNIIQGSIRALGEDRDFESISEIEGTITPWQYPLGIEDQAERICTEVIPYTLLQRKGRNLGDIAVLYLDKYDALQITNAVKKHEINYIGGDRESSYKSTIATRWLEDCAAWCTGGWRDGTPRLSTLVRFWVNLHEEQQNHAQKALRQTLISFLWANRDPEKHLSDWLEEFLSIGLRQTLELSPTRSDDKESVFGLSDATKDPNRMGNFNIGLFSRLRGSPDHLNLVTLHSSKGLEFEAVIIMGLEQGRIPRYKCDDLAEEQRKFYVGLTRAKHDVHLVYSGWYQNQFGRFNNGPSVFVKKLLA